MTLKPYPRHWHPGCEGWAAKRRGRPPVRQGCRAVPSPEPPCPAAAVQGQGRRRQQCRASRGEARPLLEGSLVAHGGRASPAWGRQRCDRQRPRSPAASPHPSGLSAAPPPPRLPTQAPARLRQLPSLVLHPQPWHGPVALDWGALGARTGVPGLAVLSVLNQTSLCPLKHSFVCSFIIHQMR